MTLQKLPRVKCGSLSARTSAFTLPTFVSSLCFVRLIFIARLLPKCFKASAQVFQGEVGSHSGETIKFFFRVRFSADRFSESCLIVGLGCCSASQGRSSSGRVFCCLCFWIDGREKAAANRCINVVIPGRRSREGALELRILAAQGGRHRSSPRFRKRLGAHPPGCRGGNVARLRRAACTPICAQSR